MSQDFGEGKWVRGRKPHRCAACRAIIPKGEEHYHYTGQWESEWQNWRVHRECHDSWEADGCGELGTDYPVPERLTK